MPDTFESASLKIAAIARELGDEDAIAQAYAELAIDAARARAAGHPTPQSRMAASGLEARNGQIYGAASRVVFGRGGSVPLGEIVFGAEFGSSIYQQFGPRASRGHWLYPAAEDDRTVDEFERTYIEDVIASHV